ncbi:MAG TPA: phage tail protein [Anaerolineaceae bacterium]
MVAPATNNPAGAAAPAAVENVDPFRSYNFKLVINGITQGHFTECTGLGVKIDALVFREAGANQVVRRIPGQVTYADVTLRYGLTSSREAWDWLMTAVKGKVERKNVSILLLDPDGVTEVMRWDLINAWASEWHGAILNAMSHEMAVESLTLVFESLERS